MKTLIAGLLALPLLLTAQSGHSLEATATGTGAQEKSSFEVRLDAKTSALEEVINRLLACNNKGMIYASNPSAPGRDSDGCVGTAATKPTVVQSAAYQTTSRGQTRNMGSNWDFCAEQGQSNTEENGSCRVTRSGNSWVLRGDTFHSGACYASCFRLQ